MKSVPTALLDCACRFLRLALMRLLENRLERRLTLRTASRRPRLGPLRATHSVAAGGSVGSQELANFACQILRLDSRTDHVSTRVDQPQGGYIQNPVLADNGVVPATLLSFRIKDLRPGN